MKYMLIIAAAEEGQPAMGTPEAEAYFGAYMAFNAEIVAQGVYLAGEPLRPVATATTVRSAGGKVILSDGPFAETKEQIGGVYIVECADLDEALSWARRVPVVALGYGAVEVRPCVDYGG